MSRTIKILLLFGALSALAVAGSSSAQATEKYFHQDSGGVATIHVTQSEIVKFNTNSGDWFCLTNTSQGTMGESTSMQLLTLISTYERCRVFGFINVPVHANGCQVVFTSATTTNGSSELNPVAHLLCPVGKSIEVTTPLGECTTKIGPQTLTGITFTNGTSSEKIDMTIAMSITGIQYDECGVVRTNGTWKGKTTVTAKNGAGGAVNLWYE